ncbi:hypothetical protein TVAG_423450 [Trichomonas vaginalis G3]|uniref:DUF3447 domain-containing protein n=1 Tax=Trichomonas vaginalis (strain ATCC PRA-98 / G3) TaxID=412133 RepID=A2DTI3_TRIV3|nr:spectrin binding [Trichomonas vaginalis G3]EAY16292.1 hypothetical protein TVAG_423450 [Trichomonas vaginalis G3]KAI5523441.1 spectrin binding [Trichomonas vaginalis G3]|eukprot:XP_001328515.1 hypothetical protein [Trichomonas vaginalis G3]
MESNEDFIETMKKIYRLNTSDAKEIESLYQDVKNKLIETKIVAVNKVLKILDHSAIFRNRYLRSCLAIMKRVLEDYHPKPSRAIRPIFQYLLLEENGIVYDEEHLKQLEIYESRNFSSSVHNYDTINRAIMNDDYKSLVFFLEKEGFDQDAILISEFYPYALLSLLDLCCYHGSVECFKLLLTKVEPKITQNCLDFAFSSGNPEILNECLKYRKPSHNCMRYAIFSHNIDFVMYLFQQHQIPIDLLACVIYNNLEAFLAYYDLTKDIDECFIYSACLNLPSLWEYFLSNGANINARSKQGKTTALHYAAMYNCYQAAEFLISHGIYIDAKQDTGMNALHKAANFNSIEIAAVLISHGIDIIGKDFHGKTALHYASEDDNKEIANLLISHGADINAKENYGFNPLHIATLKNHQDIVNLLVISGADTNLTNIENRTALHIAAENGYLEIANMLLLHSASINIIDENGYTALDIAIEFNNEKIAEFLLNQVL